jgi:hypothetical protein
VLKNVFFLLNFFIKSLSRSRSHLEKFGDFLSGWAREYKKM